MLNFVQKISCKPFCVEFRIHSATQRFSDSAIQRFSDSAIQRLSDSATQRFSDSAIQLSDSATQRHSLAWLALWLLLAVSLGQSARAQQTVTIDSQKAYQLVDICRVEVAFECDSSTL